MEPERFTSNPHLGIRLMLLGLCWRRRGRIWIRVPLTGLIARAAYRLAQKAAGSRRRARPESPSRPALRPRTGTPGALRRDRRWREQWEYRTGTGAARAQGREN